MRDIQKNYNNWIPLENSPNAIKGWGRIETRFKTQLNKKNEEEVRCFLNFTRKNKAK